MVNASICPGCGFAATPVEGPVHAYLTQSAECWARFNLSMALHYSDFAYWPAHQMLTDAYALQHSRGDDRRLIQSAALHLAALVLQFGETDVDQNRVIRLRQVLSHRDGLPVFDRWPEATVTIAAVAVDDGPEAHLRSVRAYAEQVHADWRDHHETAQRLIEDALR